MGSDENAWKDIFYLVQNGETISCSCKLNEEESAKLMNILDPIEVEWNE